LAHLDGIDDRQLRLRFERRGAAVEEQELEQEGIRGRGGIAPAKLVADAFRHRTLIGETAAHVVTGSARDGAVGGQSGFEKELLAERDPSRRHLVVRRDEHLENHRIDAWRRLADVSVLRQQPIQQRQLLIHRHGAVQRTAHRSIRRDCPP
jgi:hypothetical protein